MTDIAELEQRIAAALDRIGTGLEGIGAAPPDVPVPADADEVEALRDALEAEKTAGAQLEERIRALHQKQDERETAAEARLAAAEDQVRAAREQVQKLKQANQKLRQSLQDLRETAAEGATEPDLINQAVLSELEGLRAARDGDRAEMDAILGELKPLLEERSDA